MTLKREMANYSRKADAKIALLREVIGRVQKGEDVDVERLLGTGDEKEEKEWADGTCLTLNLPTLLNIANDDTVLKEIEQEDLAWAARKRKERKKQEGQDPIQSGVQVQADASQTAAFEKDGDTPVKDQKPVARFF